jgi:acyl-CoA dehydrogenase
VASKIMLLTRTTRYEDCKRPTDGITIFYTDLDRSEDRGAPHPEDGPQGGGFSNAIFIDDLFIPDEHRIGEEGKGFSYILHSLNPERMLVGRRGGRHRPGRAAPRRALREASASSSAGPIGQNQGIQHPLAEKWMYLEAAWLMV